MGRVVRLLLAAVVGVGGIGYGAASAFVWDRLTRVPGGCHTEWLANDPTHFAFEPSIQFDTSPYQMPAPEAVRFPSRDPAITISGWWIPAGTDAPAVVVVHGHTACKRDPTVLLAAGMLHRAGISALLIDLRDHGDSTVEDGRYAGGTEEYRDVLGAWDWLRTERSIAADRIGLLGGSLGAATVMIASGEEPRVVATWEDSSYADIGVAIEAELRRNGYPTFLEFGGVTMARLVSGDDLTSLSPLGAVAKMAGRRLFITHGTADQRLSVTYGRQLLAAAQADGVNVESWIVDGAGHTEAIRLHPTEYGSRLGTFFEGALAR
jgi:dipeptidyl aminopeptidase/acylaminoacyl peptidase